MFTPLTYDNTVDTIFSIYFFYSWSNKLQLAWLADQFLKSSIFFYACIKYSGTDLISVLATDRGRTKYLQEGKGKRLFSFFSFVYLYRLLRLY